MQDTQPDSIEGFNINNHFRVRSIQLKHPLLLVLAVFQSEGNGLTEADINLVVLSDGLIHSPARLLQTIVGSLINLNVFNLKE